MCSKTGSYQKVQFVLRSSTADTNMQQAHMTSSIHLTYYKDNLALKAYALQGLTAHLV